MNTLTRFLIALDPWLIAPFRWPDTPMAGYLLGIAILGLQCVVIGDLSATLVAFINRRYLGTIGEKMERNRRLSEMALMMGDKASYRAVNRQALDAFGHSFSMGAAIFCVSIWPLPFALAWLHLRFNQAPLELPISLPLLGSSVHYFPSFLLTYIAVRIGYGMLMGRFPWYTAFKRRVISPPGPTPDS
ncbi:MAG: hypothetical protein PVI27_05410 [Desulfobacteraceae bacterium]|jgi:hypothetical protein